MSLIKKPEELTAKTTLAVLIYGQSGMGKTTLACSAPNPVLFDFDGGVSRLKDEHQVPTVQITKWQDALDALEEVGNSAEFSTVIVDTASKMMDSIVTHICGSAQPKIQQWGLINAAFKNFLRAVQSLGRNVVFVAQREVEKDGEVNRYVPQFRASNYKDVICDLDLLGYMEMTNIQGKDVRIITFNPTVRNEGKNTAEFEACYRLPELIPGAANSFLSDRFVEYAMRQQEKSERKAATLRQSEYIMEEFEKAAKGKTELDKLNNQLAFYLKAETIGDTRARMNKVLRDKANNLNAKYNKDTQSYEVK